MGVGAPAERREELPQF